MVHRLRRECDAVLVGRSTVEADDCTLTVRRVPTTNPQPLRVILDPNLRLDMKNYRIATDGLPTIIIHALRHDVGDEARTKGYTTKKHEDFSNVTLLGIVPTKLDSQTIISAKAIVDILRSQFQIEHLMVEGGPRTALQFLDERVVDRAIVVEAPMTFAEGLPSNIHDATIQDAGLAQVARYMLDVDSVICYSRPELPWPSSKNITSSSGPTNTEWP